MLDLKVAQRKFYIWKLELWWIAFDSAEFYPEDRYHIGGNWFWRKKPKVVVQEDLAEGKCTTCQFSDFDNGYCTVGTYYADKGLLKTCYGGELWKVKQISKENDNI